MLYLEWRPTLSLYWRVSIVVLSVGKWPATRWNQTNHLRINMFHTPVCWYFEPLSKIILVIPWKRCFVNQAPFLVILSYADENRKLHDLSNFSMFIVPYNSKCTDGKLLLLEISTSRNSSSVGCLKCAQFHNWFRLYKILYQLQSILRGATHNVSTITDNRWQGMRVRKTRQSKCNALKNELIEHANFNKFCFSGQFSPKKSHRIFPIPPWISVFVLPSSIRRGPGNSWSEQLRLTVLQYN